MVQMVKNNRLLEDNAAHFEYNIQYGRDGEEVKVSSMWTQARFKKNIYIFNAGFFYPAQHWNTVFIQGLGN